MLVDKIIIERHPSKIDKDGRRHYTIRAIPYQDPQQEAERLKAVHEAGVKSPQGLSGQSTDFPRRNSGHRGAGGIATARSTYLYWLPCRGSMLRGSIIHDYVNVGPKFSRACRQQMAGDIAFMVPWTSKLNIVARALVGMAWLTLVLGLRLQLRTKAVAAHPGLAMLAVAVTGALAIGDVIVAGGPGEVADDPHETGRAGGDQQAAGHDEGVGGRADRCGGGLGA